MSSKTAAERAPRPWSLAARLTAWYAGSAFLLLLGATGFLYGALAANLDREDDQFLADKVHLLRVLLRDRPDDRDALKQEVVWAPKERQFGQVWVRVRDEAGGLILETPGMADQLSPDVFPPAGADWGSGGDIDTPGGKSFRVVAARAAVGSAGDKVYVLQLAFDRTFEEALLAGYRRNLALVLGLALGVCALVGYWIARRGLRPLREVAEATSRIRSTTLHERLAAEGYPAELAALAGTFNDMLDRLEKSFAQLERFSADIAHELRTPVNNLRGEAEVALSKPRSPEEYREVLGSCLEECGRLASLIDSLLFLARAESPEARIQRERVDVGHELTAVCELYEAAASEAGVTLAATCPEPVMAELDRTLLQRAVANLVANALAHTPAGGSVTLTGVANDGAVRVEVTDTGCGISPTHLPHVFDRFYRADAARSSGSGRVGLGLALVKSIAALHRGSATLVTEVGKGTRVTLIFPQTGTATTEK